MYVYSMSMSSAIDAIFYFDVSIKLYFYKVLHVNYDSTYGEVEQMYIKKGRGMAQTHRRAVYSSLLDIPGIP